MNEKAKPSWMPAIFWLISALISAALRLRSLNGLSGKNATPVLGVLVNCSAFRPGNAIECATPSVLMAMSLTFFSSCVGARDRGAFRQLHAGDQVQLVLDRDEAGRHRP